MFWILFRHGDIAIDRDLISRILFTTLGKADQGGLHIHIMRCGGFTPEYRILLPEQENQASTDWAGFLAGLTEIGFDQGLSF